MSGASTLTLERDRNNVPIVNMVTPVGRTIYVHLVEAREPYRAPGAPPGPPVPATEKKYSINLLLQPQDCTDIWNAVCMCAEAFFPPIPFVSGGQTVNMTATDQLKSGLIHAPLKQGDEKFKADPVKNAPFRGLFYLKAETKATRPVVVMDPAGNQASPDIVWAGCQARLSITVKPYNNGTNKGVTCYLGGVQFAGGNPATDRLGGDGSGRAASAFAAAGALPNAGAYAPPPTFGGQPAAFAAPQGLPMQQFSGQPPVQQMPTYAPPPAAAAWPGANPGMQQPPAAPQWSPPPQMQPGQPPAPPPGFAPPSAAYAPPPAPTQTAPPMQPFGAQQPQQQWAPPPAPVTPPPPPANAPTYNHQTQAWEYPAPQQMPPPYPPPAGGGYPPGIQAPR